RHMTGAMGLFAHSFSDPKRIDDAVAVTARCDLQDLHRNPSLREMISPTMAVAAIVPALSDQAGFAREARLARFRALVIDVIVFGFISFVVNSVYGVTEVTSGFITASGGMYSTTTAEIGRAHV